MATAAPCQPVLVLMDSDESTGGCEKRAELSPAPGSCGLLVYGFPLAQEWRFAVWLLGTAGQCSQSSVCSLACRAPWVSMAPVVRQTKRRHCLPHWSCSSNTFVSSPQQGYISLFRRGMAKGNKFFKNTASGYPNFCYSGQWIFLSLNAFFFFASGDVFPFFFVSFSSSCVWLSLESGVVVCL